MMAVQRPPLMREPRSQNRKVEIPRMMPGVRMGETRTA
jgi:hypothetical protein